MKANARIAWLAVGLLFAGCGSEKQPTSSSSPAAPPEVTTPAEASVAPPEAPVLDTRSVGVWRATLQSPGGALPFALEIEQADDELRAFAVNGEERVAFSSVVPRGDKLALRIDTYDSEIRAKLSGDASKLVGRWTKTTPEGPSTMEFTASRGSSPRFDTTPTPPPHAVPANIDGDWSLTFTEQDGSTFVGRGVFESSDGALRGTILTDTGDYRYLAGRYADGTFELSCFDGGHAFLFRAAVDAKGALVGDFWSRAAYHATWTATKLQSGAEGPLADPFAVVALSEQAKDGRFEFAFPDLNGAMVRHDDARFAGKVVLVDIFGTWCPNCNDYAPLLADWHRRYHDRGLEIVGLAFEMTGDVVRDKEYVGKYAKRYGLQFPVLLAGTSDKTDAAAALPTLTKIASYPTTIFIGRDGRVHEIHSGFAGPATGRHHTEMVAAMESEIEALLGP